MVWLGWLLVLLYWAHTGTWLSLIWAGPNKQGSSLLAKPLLSHVGPPTWTVWAVFSREPRLLLPSCSCLYFYLTHLVLVYRLNCSQYYTFPSIFPLHVTWQFLLLDGEFTSWSLMWRQVTWVYLANGILTSWGLRYVYEAGFVFLPSALGMKSLRA